MRKYLLIIFTFFILYSCSTVDNTKKNNDCPCNTVNENHCYDVPCRGKQNESDTNIIVEEGINNEDASVNEKIDEYNFKELEKVKGILDSLEEKSYTFNNTEEFNKKFNQNIKPIKNCYYLSSDNGSQPYIFGFKLESKKYKEKYGKEYYAYPKYDLPFSPFCDGGETCNDFNLMIFSEEINKLCNNG